MKTEIKELPVTAIPSLESPSVSALHVQRDGAFLCGLMFAHPCLFKLTYANGVIAFEDMKIEDEVGNDALGVMNGLRAATSGDTAFSVLHEGFAPGFLRKLSGGDLAGKSGDALLEFLAGQDGGMGVALRHSVVQVTEGKYLVRRFREPGALLDAAHIGDFVFGLGGTSLWREPYLNSEKREVVRKDLSGNFEIHRDNAGNFWFLGQGGRLLRMSLTDIKARPTPLKLPHWKDGARFELSTASIVDEWIYGTANAGRTLFRVRVNPVSAEDELQVVAEFPSRITGLAVMGHPELTQTDAPMSRNFDMAKVPDAPSPAATDSIQAPPSCTIVLALEHPEGAVIHAGETVPSEDPELQSPIPQFRERGRVPGIRQLAHLSWDGKALWGGEGYLGGGGTEPRKPRICRITEI